jgi:prevent-host-death family protein
MKLESLREVRNNFSEVIEALPRTGPVIVTKNGKSAALLIPIDENTDIETLVLSNSRRFWELFDRAASGKRTALEALPDANDEAAWKRLAGGRPHAARRSVTRTQPRSRRG